MQLAFTGAYSVSHVGIKYVKISQPDILELFIHKIIMHLNEYVKTSTKILWLQKAKTSIMENSINCDYLITAVVIVIGNIRHECLPQEK